MKVLLTYISFLSPSERFVAAAAAWDAFLFSKQLGKEVLLLGFRVAATRFADIRRAIAEDLDRRCAL